MDIINAFALPPQKFALARGVADAQHKQDASCSKREGLRQMRICRDDHFRHEWLARSCMHRVLLPLQEGGRLPHSIMRV